MTTLLFLALSLLPQQSPKLPTEWHGQWVGTLKIQPVDGKEQEAEMELHIEPIKETKSLKWKIIYGNDKKQQIRNYELVPQEKANHFVIDEKNGLLIDTYLVGSTLHSQFQVGDSLIPVRYELKDKTLTFSLAAYTTKDARTTKLEKGEVEAKALKLQAIQTAELRQKKQ